MTENITEPSAEQTPQKSFTKVVGGILAALALIALILAGMAYALLTSGEKQTYESPGSASDAASDVAVFAPRGASEAMPSLPANDATGTAAVEQLDPNQAIPAALPESGELPGKPLDPTNRGGQSDFDNLF
ncbi:MAG: hypothetical protein Q4G42_08695 [Neisseria sp.]|nr:hypothetical protein [Neisseria sp.]